MGGFDELALDGGREDLFFLRVWNGSGVVDFSDFVSDQPCLRLVIRNFFFREYEGCWSLSLYTLGSGWDISLLSLY